MKLKITFLLLLLCLFLNGFSQYIGVRARYTETRLVDNSPLPPTRQNRLILSFYAVSPLGVYNPVALTNYDLYVNPDGLQYGSLMGGVVDSAGNNYEGYAWTAPRAVAYYNTLGLNYIDCNPNVATHYVVNGHELDCGFVTVSYWYEDLFDFGWDEYFIAPNICLPYYQWPDIYAMIPGNVNFAEPVPATGPYNSYNFSCGGTLQYVRRGVLASDTATTVLISLPVKFANLRGAIDAADIATISFSNMTETDVLRYEVERSDDGVTFLSIGALLPLFNTGGRADYHLSRLQPGFKNYYRIKAIETNGTIIYTTVISLTKINKPSVFSVYPNPVTDGLVTVRLTNNLPERFTVSVINAVNQRSRQQIINHAGGDINHQLDLTGLPRGVYQLVLQSATQRYTQKLIYLF